MTNSNSYIALGIGIGGALPTKTLDRLSDTLEQANAMSDGQLSVWTALRHAIDNQQIADFTIVADYAGTAEDVYDFCKSNEIPFAFIWREVVHGEELSAKTGLFAPAANEDGKDLEFSMLGTDLVIPTGLEGDAQTLADIKKVECWDLPALSVAPERGFEAGKVNKCEYDSAPSQISMGF
ncbi:hypothetical protein ACQU0X_26585 [Pseudovibrio ascidiaceicola]|uniref:hypothetical protein n=1 Tax=Pseudovibrio ascidiaceicola TaxID=285279 RepID=UPI003D36855E